MSDAWTAVDEYFDERLLRDVPQGEGQSVSAGQGAFLALLVRISGARRVLEIGTFEGYSAAWLAREADEVVTIEVDPERAETARANLELAGVGDVVDIRVGDALDVLPTLHAPFDFVFLDADKERHDVYLDWAVRLGQSGTVIVADNVVRDGAVADEDSGDPRVQGVRRMVDALAVHDAVDAAALQTVGRKGWDGFLLAVVR